MFHFPIQEITSVDEIPNDRSERNTERCTLPLFHGTRRYAVECPQKQLDEMIQYCKTVVQYFSENCYRIFPDDESWIQYRREHRGELHINLVQNTVASQYGEAQYQYDSFYVTNDSVTAVKFYTIYGCGEISGYAYAYAKAISDLDFSVSDKQVDTAIEYVLKHYPDFYNSEKVVLAVYDFEYEHLRHHGGGKIDLGTPFFINHLYEDISDNERIYSQSYRLDKGIETVTAKLIPERLFGDGFRKFNGIMEGQHYMSALF